jgi:DnaJ family protein C protein 28
MSENRDAKARPDDDQPVSGEDHRRRMRYQWRDLMEDLIEDGRRRGLFDDLPGAGRPLDLEQNVFEGANTLANRLMKDNDIRPAWLNQRVEIVERIDGLRAEIGREWGRFRAAFDRAEGEGHRPALSSHRLALASGWDDACRRWEGTIDRLNKEIDSYNLKRPPGQAEIIKLRLADELRRAAAPRYLL